MPDQNASDRRCESESIDAHLSILASTESRYVVYYFQRASEEVASLDDLAQFVESSLDSGPSRSREQIRALLHHKVLPKLDDRGIVEYDHDGDEAVVRYDGSRNLEELATVAARKERQAV